MEYSENILGRLFENVIVDRIAIIYMTTKKYPPQCSQQSCSIVEKKVRSSNLELYRILCMLMIVAHHYVMNSGLLSEGSPVLLNPKDVNSLYLSLFGAWGKTGINCFLLITGYFMCTGSISLRKFIKLLVQIYIYKLLFFFIFLCFGYENVTIIRVVELIMPVWGFNSDNFVSCFMAFYLTIPFLTILIRSLDKRQHELLILISLFYYTILGSIPWFPLPFINYITWFGILFFISSYIRLYPNSFFEKCSFWGWMTILSLLFSFISIGGLMYVKGSEGPTYTYYFVEDSNKILAVSVSVSSFLWFKNMNLRYSKIINTLGAGTFGVLLIHANSNAMRNWLWKDVVDCLGHYNMNIGDLFIYSLGVVFTVFILCNLIDQLRIATIERAFFLWYDKKCAIKAEAYINKLICKL